jgi:hypothetical protein
MSQQLFHGGKIHTTHEQPTGEGMSQVVKGEINQTRFAYRSFKG